MGKKSNGVLRDSNNKNYNEPDDIKKLRKDLGLVDHISNEKRHYKNRTSNRNLRDHNFK